MKDKWENWRIHKFAAFIIVTIDWIATYRVTIYLVLITFTN